MKTIIGLIDIPDNHTIQMQYRSLNDKPKVFINAAGEVMGYIWFQIQDDVLDIEMIEIVDKEQGYGTEAIQFLFNQFPIAQITGQVLGESGMRAYWFWESLGAYLSLPFDVVESNIVSDCYFVLKRPNNIKREIA